MSLGVPADAATTKKNRVLDLIRFCSMLPGGASQMELIDYMWLQHGNTERKATEYVRKLISMGIFVPKGHKLVVNEAGMKAWETVLGMTKPAVMVICSSCGQEYSSNLDSCPHCGGYDRKAKVPSEAVISGA